MNEEQHIEQPHFPHVIDNTIRESFRNCARKFYWGHIRQLGPRNPSVHLHAGGAFASGLEHARRAFYGEGKSAREAEAIGAREIIRFYGDFDAPEFGSGSLKTVDRMVGALVSYFDAYPLETDYLKPMPMANGLPAVEFTFSIPLPIAHPITGDPLLYGGRFDMLAVKDNTLWVVDEKTTSQLGASWMGQWDLNSQFTGYCFAARSYGYPVVGAIIRGISILKNDYGHAQAIIYRPDWQLDRWYEQLIRDVRGMVRAWEEGYYDYALGAACSAYGGCTFKKLCTKQDPERWIEIDFIPRHWNPLEKVEEGDKL